MKKHLGIEREMEFREDVPRGVEVSAIMYDESSHISREAMDILIGRTKEIPLFRWPLAFLVGASVILTLAIATVCVAAASLIPM